MVAFNYGTTLKCACDDVMRAGEVLVAILICMKLNIPDQDDPSSLITLSGSM